MIIKALKTDSAVHMEMPVWWLHYTVVILIDMYWWCPLGQYYFPTYVLHCICVCDKDVAHKVTDMAEKLTKEIVLLQVTVKLLEVFGHAKNLL